MQCYGALSYFLSLGNVGFVLRIITKYNKLHYALFSTMMLTFLRKTNRDYTNFKIDTDYRDYALRKGGVVDHIALDA